MRKNIGVVRTAVFLAASILMALPGFAAAADMGHGGMQGMKMGDKVFTGKIGPWNGEASIMDMRAHGAPRRTRTTSPS